MWDWNSVSNFSSTPIFSDRKLRLREVLSWLEVLSSWTRKPGVEFRFPPSVLCCSYNYTGRGEGKDQLKKMSEAGSRESVFYGWGHIEEKWKTGQISLWRARRPKTLKVEWTNFFFFIIGNKGQRDRLPLTTSQGFLLIWLAKKIILQTPRL